MKTNKVSAAPQAFLVRLCVASAAVVLLVGGSSSAEAQQIQTQQPQTQQPQQIQRPPAPGRINLGNGVTATGSDLVVEPHCSAQSVSAFGAKGENGLLSQVLAIKEWGECASATVTATLQLSAESYGRVTLAG